MRDPRRCGAAGSPAARHPAGPAPPAAGGAEGGRAAARGHRGRASPPRRRRPLRRRPADCARTVPQLNSFAANHKDSPLADNALYWAARCYALKGDQNQAVSKFYDVVTRYPKGDKAPAALLAQGNVFVDLGDSPDARLAF